MQLLLQSLRYKQGFVDSGEATAPTKIQHIIRGPTLVYELPDSQA